MSLDAGSFGQFGALVENTGSIGRLGHALALARDGAAGEENEDVFNKSTRSTEFVGSERLTRRVTLPLGQTQRTLAPRYSDEIVPDLQAIAGAYYSWLTPLGTYFGSRVGLAYTANPITTSFRPASLLNEDAVRGSRWV